MFPLLNLKPGNQRRRKITETWKKERVSAVSSPEMPPKLSDKRRLINLLQPHFVHFLFRISSNVQTLLSFLLLLLLSLYSEIQRLTWKQEWSFLLFFFYTLYMYIPFSWFFLWSFLKQCIHIPTLSIPLFMLPTHLREYYFTCSFLFFSSKLKYIHTYMYVCVNC